MTQDYARPSLDDVLEQYAAEGPNYNTLNKYVRQFPEYRNELSDFTVQWSAMEHTEPTETKEDDPDVKAALGLVRDLLHQDTTTDPVPNTESGVPPSPAVPALAPSEGFPPATSAEPLEQMLARLDIDLFDFESRSRLGYSILINLSMGGFTFDSPEELDRVARAILITIGSFDPVPLPSLLAVLGSITMPSVIAAGQSSSPENKPEAVTKPFRRGIEDARDMTDEAKAAWLRVLDEAC